ncbi:hypothetical protein [Mangrovihabitans endophyticus]|uniref:hypothetical protein n=1 Tax=Mangrovihabitans endophyticus TaxID=1751298 RepID=UPI00166EE7A5|nr:hypothetical protein [Mangrovihabitans endophyticus]
MNSIGDLNVMSPLGQVVPRSLVAFHFPTTAEADRCFAPCSPQHATDLVRFEQIADAFHRSLGGRITMFYEQGRAGGGRVLDRTGFRHHAHYCSWPATVDTVGAIRGLTAGIDVVDLDDLACLGTAVDGRPYVLARTYSNGRCVESRLVLPTSGAAWTMLEDFRLKYPLAQQLGYGDFRDWRTRMPERTHQTAREFRAFVAASAACPAGAGAVMSSTRSPSGDA